MGGLEHFFKKHCMVKNCFDQFSKQLLEEILAPYGQIEISHEVSGEPQLVDVYFVPGNQGVPTVSELGVLGRIAQTPCLLEPFRKQPSIIEVRGCLLKLFQVHGDYQRQARREESSLLENNLPNLWILATSASDGLLNLLGATLDQTWPVGVYFLPQAFRTAIVAIDRLPCTKQTRWLRLLGKGQTQEKAIAEVLAVDPRDPRRSSILKLLANWKISIEITGQVEAEEELLMVLSQAYLEWEQQTEQRGLQQGLQHERSLILRQLTRRIGEVSPEVRSQVESFSPSQLEGLGEALLDFSKPSDLTDWLRSHTSNDSVSS
jgi:Domain of unknown function (DUF4351)